MELKLSGAKGDHVVMIFPERLNRKSSEEPYQWNRAQASVSVGAWRGRLISGDILTTEITEFLRQLSLTLSTLKGSATLETIEGWLSISITPNNLGHFEISGEISDESNLNSLRFQIDSDQSFLVGIEGMIGLYLPRET